MDSSWKFNPRRLCAAAMLLSVSLAWSFTAPTELEAGIAGRERTLVAFVLPELKACQKFKSHWELIQRVEPAAAAVDCSKEAEYCLAQDVRTHPAIRTYAPDGSFIRHRGPRETDEILSFFKRSQHLAVTASPPANFTSSDDLTIVAYLPPKTAENALLHEQFEDVAARYRDRYSFALQIVGEGAEARVGCWNNVDATEYVVRDLARVGAMEGFVKRCAAPLVGELTSRSGILITQTGKSVVTYLPTTPADKKSYTNLIRPLAKRYMEYLTFVTASTEEHPDVAASMGHPAGSLGVLTVRNTHTGEAYPMREGRVDSEGVDAFIQAISKGEVAAWDGTPVVEGHSEGEQQQSHDEL